ncbi:MAG: Ig domain-containing protein, partial [Clostridia bacterium]|nr:Ig domain-containing protein [Clostridia bacterium]
VGKRYSQQLFAYGGTGDYAFTAKGLPAGLTLSKAGKISGTPTEYGEFEAEITVTDQKRQMRTESFLFTISQ